MQHQNDVILKYFYFGIGIQFIDCIFACMKTNKNKKNIFKGLEISSYREVKPVPFIKIALFAFFLAALFTLLNIWL